MAGSVTITTEPYPDARVSKYTITWESDASGNVSGHTTELALITMGWIHQVMFVPDAAEHAPTDQYDVTLVEPNGVGFLSAGLGLDLEAAAPAAHIVEPRFWDGTSALDLVVAGAGDTKGGVVKLWFRL